MSRSEWAVPCGGRLLPLLCPALPLHETLRSSLLLWPRRRVLLPFLVGLWLALPLLPDLLKLPLFLDATTIRRQDVRAMIPHRSAPLRCDHRPPPARIADSIVLHAGDDACNPQGSAKLRLFAHA